MASAPPKRNFFIKLGSGFLGFLSGIAGIVAYPVIETISNAALGMRHYNASDSSLLKVMKGTWGFGKGTVIGFGKGLIKGIAAPFALSYRGWKGGLRDKLRGVKDDFIDDMHGLPRRRLKSLEIELGDPKYEIKLDIKPILDDEARSRKTSTSVLTFFATATRRESLHSTTFPSTMTLTSNAPIQPDLTKKEIANIRKKLKSGNHTFALLENHVSFTGPDPAAALIQCQQLGCFQTSQKTASYQLTIVGTEQDLETVCEYLKACRTKGIKITKCQIGENNYTVPDSDIRPETLVLSSPSKKLENH